MSTCSVEEGIRLIHENPDACWFAGARSDALVESAELALGFAFPNDYRTFVCELGAGSIGAEEIFGVTSPDFSSSSVPNGVWLTLSARREWGLPEDMAVIYFDGGIDYLVLGCREDDPEVKVWRPGFSKSEDELEVVASDFGSFFLSLVRQELGIE